MGSIIKAGNKLWLPGQVKPTGPFCVDWSHPLARGLLFYGIDQGDGTIIDLARGRPMLAVAGTTAATPDVSAAGTGFKWNNSDARSFAADAEIRSGAPFCAACAYVNTGTVGSFSTLFNRTANNNGSSPFINWGFVLNNGGAGQNALCFAYDDQAAYVASTAWTGSAQNTFISVLANMNGAVTSTVDLYAQGALQTTTNVNSLGSVTTNDNIIFGGASAASSANPFVGFVFYGAFWNRTLNASEVLLLHLDPYCFLVPAGEREMSAIALSGYVPYDPWPQLGPMLAM